MKHKSATTSKQNAIDKSSKNVIENVIELTIINGEVVTRFDNVYTTDSFRTSNLKGCNSLFV